MQLFRGLYHIITAIFSLKKLKLPTQIVRLISTFDHSDLVKYKRKHMKAIFFNKVPIRTPSLT